MKKLSLSIISILLVLSTSASASLLSEATSIKDLVAKDGYGEQIKKQIIEEFPELISSVGGDIDYYALFAKLAEGVRGDLAGMDLLNSQFIDLVNIY